jgi:hypothetical protein
LSTSGHSLELNEWRTASYNWLGDNRDAFSGASRAAVEQALQRHAALDAAPKRNT